MMADGDGIEVGTIGNEGAAGLTAFLGPTTSPHRMLVQVPGDSGQMPGESPRTKRPEPIRAFHDLLLKHHHAFLSQITQSVACNGLHPLFNVAAAGS